MSLRNWVVSKLAGIETAKEISDRAASSLMEKSGLRNVMHSEYRLDRCESNPKFFDNVYIGIADRNSKKVGFVISVNEDLGYAQGYLIDSTMATWHARMARNYRANRSRFGSFIDYILFESIELNKDWEMLEEIPAPTQPTRPTGLSTQPNFELLEPNGPHTTEGAKKSDHDFDTLRASGGFLEPGTQSLRHSQDEQWYDALGNRLSVTKLAEAQAEYQSYRSMGGSWDLATWLKIKMGITRI